MGVPRRRGGGRRCARCGLAEKLCICAEIRPPVPARTAVIVVLHPNEAQRPTSTGRLVPLVLERGEARIAGGPAGAVPPGALVLYPCPGAMTLDEAVARRPAHLVVPDGTWAETRRLMRSDPLLSSLGPPACVRVEPEGPRAAARLRAHPDASRLATLEAIAIALGALEGPEVRGAIESALALFVERTLAARAGRV